MKRTTVSTALISHNVRPFVSVVLGCSLDEVECQTGPCLYIAARAFIVNADTLVLQNITTCAY